LAKWFSPFPQLCTSREAVLCAAHGDNVLAGHPGIDQTYKAVSYAYYWPIFFADVAHFVRSCTVCAASKSSNPMLMGAESFSSITLPSQTFTIWAMDLIGPLPATQSRHTWIVTWVDCTSKMIVGASAKEGQMSSEALALVTFREIGLPLHLTFNNDIKFVSTVWQSL